MLLCARRSDRMMKRRAFIASSAAVALRAARRVGLVHQHERVGLVHQHEKANHEQGNH
jgi:hypothetical protein